MYNFSCESKVITFEDCFCGVPNHIGSASFIKKYQLLFGQRIMQLVKFQNPSDNKSVSDQAKVTILKQYITQKLQINNNQKLSSIDIQTSQYEGLKTESNFGILDDYVENKSVQQTADEKTEKDLNAHKSEYANCTIDKPMIKEVEYDNANLRIPECLSATTDLQLQEISNVLKKSSKFTQIKKTVNNTKKAAKGD